MAALSVHLKILPILNDLVTGDNPQIGADRTPFGDVPEHTGCGLFLRAGKQAVACVPERERKSQDRPKDRPMFPSGKEKRAPRAALPMSPFADIPRCNRPLTIPSGLCCKLEGDLPSSDCQHGDGHSPSKKTGLAASQGAQRVDQWSGVDPGKPE
jgi:hypothetical protein